MSGKAMGWALEQITELPVDKLVLIAIGNYADEEHRCFPSRKKLAKLAMCSLDTIDRAIKRLEAAGLLSKAQQPSTRGGLTSNAYTLPVGDYASAVQKHEPSRNLRPPTESRKQRHTQPHSAATLAALGAATLAAQDAATVTVNEPSIEEVPPTPKGGPTPLDALRAFEAWNATALKCALPQASKLTPDRQRKIIARLKDYGPEGWAQALTNIERSSFLTGKNDRNWTATLDFVLQPASFSKVHDGTYGNGRHAETSVATPALKPHEIELQREAAEMKRMGLI